MIGLVDRERIDAALYDDFESEKAKEVIDQICLPHQLKKIPILFLHCLFMFKFVFFYSYNLCYSVFGFLLLVW
jgi:hypothetical protein